MTSTQRLLVRVDATAATGLGHFSRCLALAQHWRAAYGPVTFIGRYDDGIGTKLERERIDVTSLPAVHPDPADLATVVDQLDCAGTVVLDGYHFDYAYQSALAARRPLLVIDDLGDLPRYAGTWLLNSSADAAQIHYRDAPPLRLLGLRYALLRRDVLAMKPVLRSSSEPIERLLVAFGGADAANDTLRILHALIDSENAPPRVRVVVGPFNRHIASLTAFARAHAGIELVSDPASMAEELKLADFVIASAGTITLELLYLGIPSLLFAVVDNQLGAGPALARLGAAIYAGDCRKLDARELARAIGAALADETQHSAIRNTAPELVDGRGAVRVCNVLTGASNV